MQQESSKIRKSISICPEKKPRIVGLAEFEQHTYPRIGPDLLISFYKLVTHLPRANLCKSIFFPVIITVLCKSNEREVRQISSYVLSKVRRNFATKFHTNTRELSLNDTKLRGDLCEISCLRK